MRIVEPIRTVAAAAVMLVAPSAGAETPLTDLNGVWEGGGTDRASPMEPAQPTRCRVTVKADPTHMSSHTECNGQAGLHKTIRLSVAFSDNRFTGTVEQTSSLRGSSAPPKRYAGAVSGNRNGDTADFVARFPGLTPNAYVVLKLTSAISFSMAVSTLGATLTDVSYHRPAAR